MSLLKKLLAILLSLMLLAMQLPALAESEEPEETEPEETEEAEEIIYPDELVVSHPTVTRGDFFTEMFGNDTADIDVRALIHGYNLVNWDQNQGVYVLDPTVVVEHEVIQDDLGNRTYMLALAEDMYFSDGTPITAWDYAFSLLLMMSPEIEQIGGKIYRAEHILGYDEYITKQAYCLGGVEVKSDHQIWITLDHEFLPYFFEVGLLLCVPYPISVIAPGCKVYDDGYGVYIGNEDTSIEEPLYTPELLAKTIMDPETGYNSHPSVVSGPYVMTSYDGVTSHFEINPYFKGAWFHNTLPGGDIGANYYTQMFDEEGNPILDDKGNPCYLVKPVIEKIAFTLADNDTVISKIADNEIHLVNKVTYAPTIAEGLETEGVNRQNYPRIGLSFMTFSYDWATVHDKEVRQAIAWCLDQKQLVYDYCGDYGVPVKGYYGIEQWEYLLVTHAIDAPINFIGDVLPDVHTPEEEEELLKHRYRFVRTEEEYEAAKKAWEMLNMDDLVEYGVDPENPDVWKNKATALLNDAGWTLNKNGEPFQEGVDAVRCKMIDDQLVSLELKMMYPEGNHIVDTIQETFIDHLNEVGITLEMVPEKMEELLKSYYRQKERTTDMIYLATNFHVIVDPSITYSTDKTANHLIWNNTYSDDEELYFHAVDMRKTDPMDVYDYVVKWLSFQKRYNEVLPTIPVYSNIYFDFYVPYLQNYWITGQVTWSQAIILAYFAEEAYEPEAPEGEEGIEFDE